MIERNAETIRLVAEAIEAYPQLYKQDHYRQQTECGSAFCIAGWVAHLDGVEDEMTAGTDFDQHAAARMGLRDDEAYVLFNATWRPAEGMTVPEALRRLAEGASMLGVTVSRQRSQFRFRAELNRDYRAEMEAHA